MVIQGLGLCAQPHAYAIVSEVVPKKYRAIMQGSANFSAGLGGTIGALVCGAICEFYINVNGYKKLT